MNSPPNTFNHFRRQSHAKLPEPAQVRRAVQKKPSRRRLRVVPSNQYTRALGLHFRIRGGHKVSVMDLWTCASPPNFAAEFYGENLTLN